MVNFAEIFLVIGFALSTVTIIGWDAVRAYRNYIDKMKVREREISESIARQQHAIERWKRKVLRP